VAFVFTDNCMDLYFCVQASCRSFSPVIELGFSDRTEAEEKTNGHENGAQHRQSMAQ
jgi:hypothetical protein